MKTEITYKIGNTVLELRPKEKIAIITFSDKSQKTYQLSDAMELDTPADSFIG